MHFVDRLIGQHLSGAFDHSAPLWQLLMFDAFLRNSPELPNSALPQQEELQCSFLDYPQ
jgi:asparagine synthase (glutamine-hydrolysing)